MRARFAAEVRRARWVRWLPLLVGAAVSSTCACTRRAPPDGGQAVDDAAAASELEHASPALPEPPRPKSPVERCRREIDRLTSGGERASGSELQLASDSDSRRASVLLSAKSEPTLFVRPPRPEPERSELARALSRQLAATKYPWDVLRRQLASFARDPDLGRQSLLREGYLFAERPDHAFALVDLVRPDHLFRAPQVWVHRGNLVIRAHRASTGRYVVSDGADAGRPLRLLLYDRVGTGPVPPPLHRDLRALRHELHFERMRVSYVDDAELVAQLRYGTHWVPTLLRSTGARLELACEALSGQQASEVRRQRDANRRHAKLVQALRQAMLEQIQEAMFFDEPLTEIGQQDGRLRPGWRFAYLQGRQTYRFNGDSYPVFNAQGRPIPPQVCVDFLLDTLARASGTWWFSRNEARGRSIGVLDWDEWGRFALRPVVSFIELVERETDTFSVMRPAAKEVFGIGDLPRLERYLLEHADDYRSGDMVLIFGFTPWDRRERHYHSFFVYESDPITGVPMVIAGNAGRPALRTWRVEARRTPEREIIMRIRPKMAWLRHVVPTDAPLAPEPPPLSMEPIGPIPWPVPGRR